MPNPRPTPPNPRPTPPAPVLPTELPPVEPPAAVDEKPAAVDEKPAGVTLADTAALTGQAPATAEPAPRRRIVVSQGTYDDLARLRKVTDPGTGYELRVGDDGKVTAYDRATGKPADITVACPVID